MCSSLETFSFDKIESAIDALLLDNRNYAKLFDTQNLKLKCIKDRERNDEIQSIKNEINGKIIKITKKDVSF